MNVGTTTMAATNQGFPAAGDLAGESAATVICQRPGGLGGEPVVCDRGA